MPRAYSRASPQETVPDDRRHDPTPAEARQPRDDDLGRQHGVPLEWAKLTFGHIQTRCLRRCGYCQPAGLSARRPQQRNEIAGAGLYRAREPCSAISSIRARPGSDRLRRLHGDFSDRLHRGQGAGTSPRTISPSRFQPDAPERRVQRCERRLSCTASAPAPSIAPVISSTTRPLPTIGPRLSRTCRVPSSRQSTIPVTRASTIRTRHRRIISTSMRHRAGAIFYCGAWHPWLVGGLGAGGAPLRARRHESDREPLQRNQCTAIVNGEWNASTIACINVSAVATISATLMARRRSDACTTERGVSCSATVSAALRAMPASSS